MACIVKLRVLAAGLRSQEPHGGVCLDAFPAQAGQLRAGRDKSNSEGASVSAGTLTYPPSVSVALTNSARYWAVYGFCRNLVTPADRKRLAASVSLNPLVRRTGTSALMLLS